MEDTLQKILEAAKAEFSQKGFQHASLRSIVKTAGVTTGAFYGYYKSKEALFEALVGEHYQFLMNRFRKAQSEFAALPQEKQPENLGNISQQAMFDMLHYAYQHLTECKLILCRSEGTRFSRLIDEMVEIETNATHDYQAVLTSLGQPCGQISPKLEHILITGMFNAFFELVLHEMPLKEAEDYLYELQAFYTAGWMKLMGQ